MRMPVHRVYAHESSIAHVCGCVQIHLVNACIRYLDPDFIEEPGLFRKQVTSKIRNDQLRQGRKEMREFMGAWFGLMELHAVCTYAHVGVLACGMQVRCAHTHGQH